MNIIKQKHLQLLSLRLQPADRRYNIVQVLELFPTMEEIHQLFRDVCVHYEQPTISYTQINQYVLGHLLRKNAQNHGSDYHGERLRLPDKVDKQDFKVCFICGGCAGHHEDHAKNLIMEEMVEGEMKVYGVTNRYMREFCLNREEFVGPRLTIEDYNIMNLYMVDGVIGIITSGHKLVLQTDPSALKTRQKKKTQLYPTIIHTFPTSEVILWLSASCQEEWLVVSTSKLYRINVVLGGSIDDFQTVVKVHTFHHLINKVVSMVDGFVGLGMQGNCFTIFDVKAMQVSNRIYNDTEYSAICFNQLSGTVVAADHAAYLMAMRFQHFYGDIEEEGLSFKKSTHAVDERQTTPIKKLSPQKSPSPKLILDDVPLSKQVKTPYTIIIKNSSRKILSMLCSLQKSVISYEQSPNENTIKFWDITTLRVYKKIQINSSIGRMAVCSKALFTISAEKGHVNYYKLQKLTLLSEHASPINIVQMQICSNYLMIFSGNIKQNKIHKLHMAHQPKIVQFLKFAQTYNPKTFKLVYLKNQLYTFNMNKPQQHQLDIYGAFGELVESVSGEYNEYYEMLHTSKNRIIFYGKHKLAIRGKRKKQQIFKHSKQSNLDVYERIPEQVSKGAQKQIPSICTVLFEKTSILTVKHLDGYICVICGGAGVKTVYLFDEDYLNMFVVGEIGMDVLVLGGTKDFVLLREQEILYLYDCEREACVWRSGKMGKWQLEDGRIGRVGKDSVTVVMVYKSTRQNLQKEESIFQIKRQIINVKHEKERKIFFTEDKNKPIYEYNDQHFTIDDLIHRSIPTKLKIPSVTACEYRSSVSECNITKISIPTYIIEHKNIKVTESMVNNIVGKVLYYGLRDDDVGVFVMWYNAVAWVGQFSDEDKFGRVIGLLDFQAEDPEAIIVEWNSEYKKNQHEIWKQTKQEVIDYIKKKSINSGNPIKFDQEEEDLEEQLVVPPKKMHRSQSQKVRKIVDPVSINQLFYKNYIHKSIEKEEERMNQKDTKSMTRMDESRYEQLVMKTRKTVFTESNGFSQFDKSIRMSSEVSQSISIRIPSKKREKKHIQKKETLHSSEALAQLQKSKMLALPSIMEERKKVTEAQNTKKKHIQQLLLSKTLALRQSRICPSRLIKK